MPEVISDTSPLQYLHQVNLLYVLPTFYGTVVIPTAVDAELAAGRTRGIALPEPATLPWMTVRTPHALLDPRPAGLGEGEAQVLALCTESADAIGIIDDALARRVADDIRVRYTGTLGLVLRAKATGLLPAVAPVLDELQSLRFRLSPATRRNVLRLAGEPI